MDPQMNGRWRCRDLAVVQKIPFHSVYRLNQRFYFFFWAKRVKFCSGCIKGWGRLNKNGFLWDSMWEIGPWSRLNCKTTKKNVNQTKWKRAFLWEPSSSSSSSSSTSSVNNNTSWNLEQLTHFGVEYFSPKYKKRRSDDKDNKAGQSLHFLNHDWTLATVTAGLSNPILFLQEETETLYVNIRQTTS